MLNNMFMSFTEMVSKYSVTKLFFFKDTLVLKSEVEKTNQHKAIKIINLGFLLKGVNNYLKIYMEYTYKKT